ncbi:MAG TPA: hypothetical protein DEH78_19945 [Solibacterales bacterium]|nr:hypothetical protein [Bryobacterales bacterium]
MRRWKSRVLLLILTLASLAQSSTPLLNPEVRRLGNKLRCQCGCEASVTECNMINCHSADPLRAELLKMVEAGQSEASILAAMVERHGKIILRQPPTQGFFLLGWVMPFAAAAAGLAFLWWFLRRKSKPAAAAAETAPDLEIDDPELARYRERIEKDLAKLD